MATHHLGSGICSQRRISGPAILVVSVPATISTSDWLGLARKGNMPKRSMSLTLVEFRHYAFYNPVAGRIEMHLVSLAEQNVSVAGQRFHFALGETLHTEHSYKFRADEFSALAQTAGWQLAGEWDHDGFAVQLYG